MKNLSTLFFACFFLVFMSCSKEEIISPDHDLDNGSLIINPYDEEVEGGISENPVESSGDNYYLPNNNPTVVAIQSAIDYLATEPDMSMFHEALVKTDMDAVISGNGPYTIFAPNNQAFQNFLENNNWNSLDEILPGTLSTIVKFHISTTDVTIEDLNTDTAVPILFNNQTIFIHTTSSPAYITLGLTEADVLSSDIEVSNGNINKLNAVLSL